MFTGIIEEIGKIAEYTKLSDGARLKVSCKEILDDIKIGDSISVNGCCQTVVEFTKDSFISELSEETLKVTNFGDIKSGYSVNLERALTPTTRMGGHIVQGHVDCTGKLISVERLSGFYNMRFEIPEKNTRYVVNKGSVAVNGISLTVANMENNIFSVAVIPHTYSGTTLAKLNIGESVNIETDVLGRYVEKFLSSDNNSSRLSENFLRENGFI